MKFLLRYKISLRKGARLAFGFRELDNRKTLHYLLLAFMEPHF